MSRIGGLLTRAARRGSCCKGQQLLVAVHAPLSGRHHRDGRFDKRIRTGARTPLRTVDDKALLCAADGAGIRFAQESTTHRKEIQSVRSSWALVSRQKETAMTGRKFSIFLSTLLVAAVLRPYHRARLMKERCAMTPVRCRRKAPNTPAQMGRNRLHPRGRCSKHDGWIWAALKDASKVALPANALSDIPSELGALSYFTKIESHELHQDELASALSAFHDGLEFKESDSRVYRVDIAIASGESLILFFDFGTFAGGMWCPEDGCVEESRFLIMKQENKGQIITASILDMPAVDREP